MAPQFPAPLADFIPTAPADKEPLPSFITDAELSRAHILRSRELRRERVHYDQQEEMHRILTKLVVEVSYRREETWYLVSFITDDPEVPNTMENYREFADATAAYQRLF